MSLWSILWQNRWKEDKNLKNLLDLWDMILNNKINNSNFLIKVNKKTEKNFQEILYLLNLQTNKWKTDKFRIKILFKMIVEDEWLKSLIKKTKFH